MINYFLVEGKERKGPFTKEQVLLFYKNLRINNSTLIWREGLDGWVKIQDLEEFRVKPKASSQIKTKEEDLKDAIKLIKEISPSSILVLQPNSHDDPIFLQKKLRQRGIDDNSNNAIKKTTS